MRLSGLGEERVWSPSPLTRVDILAMGLSGIEYVQECYHAGVRKPGHEVWTINSGVLAFQYDKVWNMHDLSKLHEYEAHNYEEIYKTIDKPLITVRALESIPNSLEFPLQEFFTKFGSNYVANTVCYMIIGALMCGVKELGIWGADYEYPDKTAYEAGRGGVEFWLGYAHAKGVKIQPAKSSTLMDMRWRIPPANGAIGYGAVYGYFNSQPNCEMTEEGLKIKNFGTD